MAAYQVSYKWILTSLLALLTILLHVVHGCQPTSKELHICLNIYLERDFSLVETIVNGQQSQGKYGRRRIILEGPDLQNICRHIANLRDCYSALYMQCNSLWQLDRFQKMMGVLRATHNHLCQNGTDNVKDLLLNTGCLFRAQTHIENCTGFDWALSWRQVLRLQVSSYDRCMDMMKYRECLKNRLSQVVCGSEALPVYSKLIDVWLKYWCAENATVNENRKFFYAALNQI